MVIPEGIMVDSLLAGIEFTSVGAVNDRPRATNGRPYGF